MQLKATKFAALFSRLNFAPLALFAAFGLCAAAPQTAQADQWFRFTITGRANYKGDLHDYIQLDEFALVDESGTVVSRGLQQDTSGSELPAADKFKYSGPYAADSQVNLFTQGNLKYCVPKITSVNPLDENQRPIFTIHLGPSVAPVAGYNLRSGNDTGDYNGACYGRAPVAWTIETSLDGGATWVVIDTKTVSNDAGLTSNNTWYDGGGSSNDGPTTFYPFSSLGFLRRLAADERRVAVDDDPYATGGDIVLKAGDDYIHVFYDTSAAKTFTVNKSCSAEILAVGGGGSGGGDCGGGGGAGGLVYKENVLLTPNDYTVTVGAGGAGPTEKIRGNTGSNTSFKLGDANVIDVALGGGGGGMYNDGNGASGGSGGGACNLGGTVGVGSNGQGNNGGKGAGSDYGGGGGGAGAAGSDSDGANGGSGGDGLEYGLRFFGWQQYFAGGGGGGNPQDSNDSVGGLGGGGKGGCTTASTFSAGENGLGAGGGGGGGGSNKGGGAGGSGIVIIRCSPRAAQWFRVTFTERWGRSDADGNCYDGYFQLGEFALFDELGNQVNKNLTMGTSATELAPNQYFAFDGGVNADMCFNGSIATVEDRVCFSLGGGYWLSRTAFLPQSITMRLAEDAATVVKYNLATGADTGESIYRHPSAWKLEASSDGVNWTVVDEQRIDGASWVGDWIDKNKASVQPSWYAGGGKGEKPTKFYALQPQELPLPAGFTRLEWIKSTRAQRILTDYYPNPKTWMQVDCMFTGGFKCSKGAGDWKMPDDCINFIFSTCNEWYRPTFNLWFGDETFQTNALYFSVNNRNSTYPNHNLLGGLGTDASRNLLTVSNGTYNAWLDWPLGIEKSGSTARNDSTCPDPLMLFGLGDKNFGAYEMTVWSWKIYESDSGSGVNDPSSHLVHNFIPALSPTGVPGLFDSITGEFLSSATATPFEYQEAGQWFRFTILKRLSNEENFIIQLGKFGLYTADGKNVATNLARYTTDAQSVPAGQFYYSNNVGNLDAFHSEWLFDEDYSKDHKFGATSAVYARHTFTMHLAANADEVVKYNMMSANDTAGAWLGRAPSMWTLERSYDGVVWEMVDEQLDEATCGYPTTGYTWYNNGGRYNDTTGANAVPTNFYWLAELPLPELLQSEYDYVGYKLVPAVKGAEGLIASGTTAATNTGTYKIVYSLPAGAKWVGGSTAPYEIEWSIVSPRPKFLERLAADTRRVDATPSVYSAYATGGDLVLKDEDLGVFIHVFTNTAAAKQFTANSELKNVDILVVGGGGQGGAQHKGCSGGGGAGGVVYSQGLDLATGAYQVSVGHGGANGDSVGSNNGTDSSLSGSGLSLTAKGGGHGGGNEHTPVQGSSGGCGGGSQYKQNQSSIRQSGGEGSDGQGFRGGSVLASLDYNFATGGGGAGEPGADVASASDLPMGGNGRRISILGFDQVFGGGGAGWSESNNSSNDIYGGIGGGGSIRAKNSGWGEPGENGLGGGGAGQNSNGNNPSTYRFGGDGIVIVRYSYNTTANVKVAKPTAKAGLLYNGCTQLAVEEGEGYVLSGRVSADNAGSYTATATLLAGYEWADGSTSALTLSWRIDPAPITGVRLSANEAQYTGSSVAQPTVVAVTTANGLTITDANCGWDFGYERDRKETTDFTSLGYISVVVTGKGNLTGTKAATFRIYDPKKIPLPKPVPASYEYTGSAITPTFEPAPSLATYTLSGVTSTNQIGVYTVTCTLKDGCSWENGSTGPYEVTWEIVKKQTFLEKLASDPRRVNDEGETDFDSGLAQGGDLVLFDPEASAFIHVFTNTAAAATFTPSANLNARVLLVGGGGAGNKNCGGGGGGGGVIEADCVQLAVQGYAIQVGAGQKVASNVPVGDNGGASSISALGLVAGGGGKGGGYDGPRTGTAGLPDGGNGGGSLVGDAGAGAVGGGHSGGSGDGMEKAGGGGGAGADGGSPKSGVSGGKGGDGLLKDILGFDQYFGGGGGGSGKNASVSDGGLGGGGIGSSTSTAGTAGENGLGGGGGGGESPSTASDWYAHAGGDGIVIIRYMATPPITVPVPKAKTGLFYNGNTQVGVPESFAYTLADYYATTAGTYTATATLNHGYRWADSTGDNDLTRTVEWTILNYMRLEAIDNGSDPAKAGYVPLTGFKPKKNQAFAMTFSMNRELMNIAQMLFAVSYSDDGDVSRTWQWNLNYTHHGGVGARVLSYAHGTYNGSSFDTNAYVPITNPKSVVVGGVHTAVFARTLAKMSIDGEPIEHNITGVTVGDALMEFPHDFGNDLTLFCSANVAGNPLGADGMIRAPALAKIYGFTVMTSEDDPTPVLDLVPVRRTDGVRGFYDLVNGNFYPLKTPVVLDGNGGEPAQQYVYTSNGELMPALPEKPTRAGFDFNGYALNGWEVKPMTGKETDFIDEGESIWAYMAYAGGTKITLNKTDFVRGLNTGINQGSDTTNPAFTMDVGFSAFNDYPKSDSDFTGCIPDYKNIVNAKLEFQDTTNPRHDRVTFTLKQGLEKGKSYAVQIISYHYTTDPNSQPTNRLGFSENTYYENCAPVNPMGVSFVYRFEATNTTHSFTLYKPTEVKGAAETAVFLSISAIQLREIGEDASVMDKYLAQYYDENGTPVKACDFGEGTTLYAQWEPGKYRVIDPENGPKIAVDPEWLNGAFGSDVNYQAKLFTTNASGVVAWQAYVLGYEASEVVTAAIVEETAQNADPDTVTIRLRGMPEKPRTNETSRLAYSLYAAKTPEGLLNGGGTVVTNLEEKAYYKWPKSTFEAPLKDLTDAEPVNYYRIKVHFIFNKSE